MSDEPRPETGNPAPEAAPEPLPETEPGTAEPALGPSRKPERKDPSMEKTDWDLGAKLAGLAGSGPSGSEARPPASRQAGAPPAAHPGSRAGSHPAHYPAHHPAHHPAHYPERHPAPQAAPRPGPQAPSPSAPAGAEPPDLAILREHLRKKQTECSALAGRNEGLRTEIEALRTDYTVQQAERLAEIEALKQVVTRSNEETRRLEGDVSALKKDNKELKAQNLSLQYHLNLWGIPVCAGGGTEERLQGTGEDGNTFFPALTPLAGAEDPIPIVLRGDLAALAFPDLLQFLASSKRSGVVTVVTDQIVAKLYLENSVLRLAGWNNRDPELGLLALLEEAELLAAEVCEEFRESRLYDLELAERLVAEKNVPADTVRIGLREHTRVILSYLFQVNRGTFFFQPGQIPRRKDLQFQLLVTDLLLKTAAEMDEKTRDLGEELSRSLAQLTED